MRTDVSFRQLWFNPSMWGFFLRKQAQNELEKLVTLAGGRDSEHAFSELDDALESNYGTLDEFEEDLYNLSAEEILENLGYTDDYDDRRNMNNDHY